MPGWQAEGSCGNGESGRRRESIIDTLVVGSITGFVTIGTGVWNSGDSGAALTTRAFSLGLPGESGGLVVSLGLVLFAYSTIPGWNYYGEKALEYRAGHTRWAMAYRVAWVVAAFFGATLTLDTVWAVSDVMNGAMAIPNLIGLIGLSGLIGAEAADYLGARAEEPQRT